ncbi:MAG: hypothetical protein ACRBI6_00265 [Acidimicrobiales bacterium]
MTLRDAIEGLLGPTTQRPAADALADEGHDSLGSDLFGTALGHYADTAPIEQADALAPIVTRTSSVPFEADDLPESDLPIDGDALALFDAADPASMIEADTPLDIDEPIDTADAVDAVVDDPGTEAGDVDVDGDEVGDPFAGFGDDFGDEAGFEGSIDSVEAPAAPPVTTEDFGVGSTVEPLDDLAATDAEALEGFDELPTSFEAPVDGLDISGGVGLGDDLDADEEMTSLFSTDFTEETDGADPDDLDLDFDA